MASIRNTSPNVQRFGCPATAPGLRWRLRRLACIALTTMVLVVATITPITPFALTANQASASPRTHGYIADANCGGIIAGCH
jgi:hypothetical protein